MKRKLTVALAAAALAVVPMTAASASSHDATLQVISTTVSAEVEGNPQITVVHGVPGLEVDVFADGGALIEGFEFTDIVTTTDVAAGTYAIAVAPAGEGADAAVLGPLDLTFEEGMSYAVVAHLDADGEPTASFFEVNAGTGVSAFHTAAFPAVAIVAGGEIAADDLTNGNAAQLDLDAGTELPGVGIAAAGSTDIALPVGDLTVPEGERILAFAVGAPAEAGDDGEEMEQPTSVDSGTGGLVESGLPMWVAGLMLLGALGLAVPAVSAARRRS